MTKLGTSDLDIFPINLGGNVFGWTANRDASFAILDAFVAGGGNFIDTADSYSAWVPDNRGGESETIIGEWLADRKPQNVIIATKVGQHPEYRGQSASNVRAAAEASLKRLGVEAIDLYYIHEDDQSTPLEETVEAHGQLVSDGLVRYTALSNFSAERIREWHRVAAKQDVPPPVALQPKFNLLAREPFESELQSVAQDFGLAVLPYSSLASGFLTGKYRSQQDIEQGSSPRAGGLSTYATETGFALLDLLERIANEHGASISAVALAALRSQSTVAAPIASASRVDQVADLLASATLELGAEGLAEIDRLTRA